MTTIDVDEEDNLINDSETYGESDLSDDEDNI